MIIISIEGNIGSGKSTILNRLRENINDRRYSFVKTESVLTLPEPVEQWEEDLKDFYEDRTSRARYLQEKIMKSMISHLQTNIESSTPTIVISERSVLSSQHVFAQNLFENGEISGEDINTLADILNSLDSKYKPSSTIYIRTSPSKCIERIYKRNRLGEKNIDAQYIIDLHNIHERWILSMTEGARLTLNNDEDGEDITINICDTIMSYIETLITKY